MTQKVFITKYALTTGIIEKEMELNDNGKHCCGMINGFSKCFFGNDFHLTKEDSILDAKLKQQNKIKSLKKELLKIENLKF